MGGVVRACGPDFVEEEKAGLIDGVMEIVLEAAFFFASGSDKRADFGFQQKVLALFGAQDHDQSDRVFGEFAGFQFVRRLFGAFGIVRLFRFSFGHDGGDCIAVGGVCKAYSSQRPMQGLA